MAFEKQRLLQALEMMAELQGMIQDTHGNVSVRVGDDRMWIKPSGVPYDRIVEDDLCEVKFGPLSTWEQTQGILQPSVDTVHHAAIYANNPRIKAICHTHSPHVVAHAILENPIICASTEQADYFGEDVFCVAYASLDKWGAKLEDLVDHKAILLGKHGGLTFADCPIKAVKLAVQLENVARKNVLAGLVNVPLLERHNHRLSDREIRIWHRRFQEVYGQR